MFDVVVWLMLFVSVFMIIIVLVQRSKGGGLNQSFASQAQIMGVRKSTDFVEKATWTLAVLLFVFSLSSVAFFPSGVSDHGEDGIDKALDNMPAGQVQQAPAFDAQAPANLQGDSAEESAPASSAELPADAQ